MRLASIFLTATCIIQAKDCISKPCSTAFNFAYDMIGTPDTRPGTWGDAAASSPTLKFKPPAGYRTRILRAYGDFVVWPRGKPAVDPTDKVVGTAVGTLLGLSTTAPDASEYVEGGGASDACFLYIQIASKGEAGRAPFDYDTHVGGLLEADNMMVVKAAVWLNTTGLAVHMEPSITVIFQFEKEQ